VTSSSSLVDFSCENKDDDEENCLYSLIK